MSSASSFFTTQQGILKAKCVQLSSTIVTRVFRKIFCDRNKKVWFLERIIRALPELLLVEPHHPGPADNMITCWSGTSSFACQKADSSVCPRHIKLLPYTCQECLATATFSSLALQFPFSCSGFHIRQCDVWRNGEWSLPFALCRALLALF